MNVKIAAISAAWLFIASNFADAQTGYSIKGKVTDTARQVLEGATVYLKRATDSVLVKTELTDKSGDYIFLNIKPGTYRIFAGGIGYVVYQSDTISLQHNRVKHLTLLRADKNLSEVSVVGRKPVVEHRIDRNVVNVDALTGDAGNTAMDVLDKSPGVIVTENGAISLNGKGVKLFIDDRPANLSGAELESYLRAISSSTIDQVELMSNPPARYEAAGNGGVINIRLKKSRVSGFNGGLNLSYSQGSYGKTTNGFNFNYRKNKVNVFGNLSYNTTSGFTDLDLERHFLDENGTETSGFMQNSFIRRTSKSFNSKIGIDYYASAKTTIGLGFNGLSSPREERILNKSLILDQAGIVDSTIAAKNREESSFQNGGINLNYRHQFDQKGHELTADLDYIGYKSQNDQRFDNTSFLADGTQKSNDLLTGNLPSEINIYSIRSDYSRVVGNGFKLESGIKGSFIKTDNIADYFYTINGITSPDYDKTNHFIYQEQISAGYLNTRKEWKRISVQVGLRFENTASEGHQLGNFQKRDSVFSRHYNSLFPTFYLQYKLDSAGSQSINFNYGKRIDRPAYGDLNPFISPLDKFTFYVGNPFLKPAYTHNLELSHTWKNITTTLNYSHTSDQVNETIEILDGIYYSRPGNLGKIIAKGIAVDADFNPAKWLNFHWYSSATNIHTISNFYTGELNTQGTFFFVRPMVKFKLPRDWTLQLDGGYQSRVTNAQFVSARRGKVNLAVAKKLSASTGINLTVNDLFYTFAGGGDINNLANTRASYRNLNDSRTVVLSLSYRFGKTIADLRKHNANGAESEQDRVRN